MLSMVCSFKCTTSIIVLECSSDQFNFVFINCYVVPSASFWSFLNALESILETCSSKFVLLTGDSNAKNPIWDGNILDEHGEHLLSYLLLIS